MSLLVIGEILGLSVNTFIAEDKYYLVYMENLPLTIKIQETKILFLNL